MNNWDFFHLDGMIPTIRQHTDEQLDIAIMRAEQKFPDDFYILLHGIDAYMERRRRIVRRLRAKRDAKLHDEIMQDLVDPWGNS
jgi:hypothetical protein